MHTEILDRVAEFNPAPARPLTPEERNVKARLLAEVMADTTTARHQPRGRRKSTTRMALIAASAVAAVVLAAVVVVPRMSTLVSAPQALGAEGLSAASVASWTPTPSPLPTSAPVVSFCKGFAAKQPFAFLHRPELSNGDLRGTVGSVIVTQGRAAYWCLMGEDGVGIMSALSGPHDEPSLKPGQVSIDGEAGAHGIGGADDADSAGFAFIGGFAAADVTRVVVSDGTHETTATLQNGRWTAWWPVSDWETASSALPDDAVTVTTTAGRTATLQLSHLPGA